MVLIDTGYTGYRWRNHMEAALLSLPTPKTKALYHWYFISDLTEEVFSTKAAL